MVKTTFMHVSRQKYNVSSRNDVVHLADSLKKGEIGGSVHGREAHFIHTTNKMFIQIWRVLVSLEKSSAKKNLMSSCGSLKL